MAYQGISILLHQWGLGSTRVLRCLIYLVNGLKQPGSPADCQILAGKRLPRLRGELNTAIKGNLLLQGMGNGPFACVWSSF